MIRYLTVLAWYGPLKAARKHEPIERDGAGIGSLQRPPFLVAAPDHDLTVVIPAYNEEKRLALTLAQLTAFLDGWGLDYRVLVADDGSTDSTVALARRFGSRCGPLCITPHHGKGRAVREAMLQATGRVLAFTDADLPFELSALRTGYDWIYRGQCRVVFAPATSTDRGTWPHAAWPAAWPPTRFERSFAGLSPAR